MGYPIMLKAAAGGGGKGMREVSQESDLENALNSARSEAINSFGDDSVYMEKELSIHDTLKFKCWQMRREVSITYLNETVPFNVVTKSC